MANEGRLGKSYINLAFQSAGAFIKIWLPTQSMIHNSKHLKGGGRLAGKREIGPERNHNLPEPSLSLASLVEALSTSDKQCHGDQSSRKCEIS